MTIQVSKPEDRPYRLVLVYGPTGAGKSWFGASAESRLGGRTLIAMTEDSDSGLTGFDVDLVPVRGMEQLKQLVRDLRADPGPYKDGVLVLDSLTQLERFADAEEAEAEYRRQTTKTPLQVTQEAYGRMQEDIRRTIWATRTLPLNIVLVCLDKLFTDKNDVTIRLIGPNLTPRLSGDIRAYSDVVGYMTAETLDVQSKDGKTERRLVRRLFLQPGHDFAARARAGKGVVIPEFIASPTIEKLLAIFKPKEEAKT